MGAEAVIGEKTQQVFIRKIMEVGNTRNSLQNLYLDSHGSAEGFQRFIQERRKALANSFTRNILMGLVVNGCRLIVGLYERDASAADDHSLKKTTDRE
jgi:hypothetical protein